jgi:hypothetical protein
LAKYPICVVLGKKMGLAKKWVLEKLGGIFKLCEGIDIPKGAEELRIIFR